MKTYPEDNLVDHRVQVSPLDGRLRRCVVHQQLGVTAGEHDESVAPGRVAHRTAAQQQVTNVKCIRLTRPQQSTVELTDGVVRRLTHHFSCRTTVPRTIYSALFVIVSVIISTKEVITMCGSVVLPDLRSVGRGFESQPPRCRVQPGQVNTRVSLSASGTSQ